MLEENTFKIKLRSKIFLIPTNFRSLIDVDQNVYLALINQHQYEVQSNISEKIFQCFIDHWIYNKIPNLNLDNISEYEQLSKEFDRMENLIQIFKKNMPNVYSSFLITQREDLENKLKESKDFIEMQSEKQQKIMNALFKNGKFAIHSIIPEIRNDFFNACCSKCLKFVNILTQKVVKFNGLLYILNEENKTADVLKNIDAVGEIFIPRSIAHDSKEFVVCSIIENAFKNSNNINSIQFPQDSELKLIDQCSFFASSLETISIPPKVAEIGQSSFYLCKELNRIEFIEKSELKIIQKHAFYKCPLKNITIPSSLVEFIGIPDLISFSINPENRNFMNYENDYILGKSNIKSDVYDILLFSRRDIKKSTIPSFITQIAPFAFRFCDQLKEVNFAQKSELKIIGLSSFSFTAIEKILIPSNVTQICEDAFTFCENLHTIEFEKNSKLQIIGKNAFAHSSITSISIPRNVINIMEFAFYFCKNLQKIDFTNDSELKYIGEYAFANSSISNISIPVHLSRINHFTFSECRKLELIDFQHNSELKLIGKNAFYESSINNILIPKNVIKIDDEAFKSCRKLKKVEFDKNSELRLIGKSAFSYCLFENIVIPSNVYCIGEKAFINCWKISTVDINSNYDLHLIEKKIFNSSIKIHIKKHKKWF